MQLIKKHIYDIGIFLGVWTAYFLLDIHCPFLLLTGSICPTCGSTRAILALLHGDFKGYLSYQPMAVPLAIAVILCAHLQYMKKRLKKFATAIVAITLLSNTVIYILKLQIID